MDYSATSHQLITPLWEWPQEKVTAQQRRSGCVCQTGEVIAANLMPRSQRRRTRRSGTSSSTAVLFTSDAAAFLTLHLEQLAHLGWAALDRRHMLERRT